MSKIIELSQDFNGTQAIWSLKEEAVLNSVKDWLEQAITYSKGFLKPVQAVLAEVMNLILTTDMMSKWRRSLCASIRSSNPKPLLAEKG